MKVNNKGVLRKITWRSLAAGRFRNIIAVLAIALTAVLFTTVTTMGGAMLQSIQESTFRQVGGTAHGSIKYLTRAQYEHIAASDEYEDISYTIVVGIAANDAFSKKQHEVRYAEDKSAEWGFSYPTVGTMPRAYKDIVLSDLSLSLLGLTQELGQTVRLKINMGGLSGEVIEDDFTLAGIYPGDDVMTASQIYLSYDYVMDTVPDLQKVDLTAGFAGIYNAELWFSNSVDIESKLNNLLIERGLDPAAMSVGVNWAYAASGSVDVGTVLMAVGLVLMIMASGYLIIYSIFAISVTGDIQFYGLLKTIGTTKPQIRRIVRSQALILSALGIPLGLIVGYLLGGRLLPVLTDMFIIDMPVNVSVNPLVFVIAALFSLVTVLISCRKPGKMAARVSPIEALRYTEASAGGRKKEKKSRRVSPFSMAWANVNRSKKRLAVIVLSLSLSLVLLNSIVSVVNGFDMDIYLESSITSDVYLTHSSVLSFTTQDVNYEGIPDGLIEEAAALPGVEGIGRVIYRDHSHSFESAERLGRFEEIVAPYVSGEYNEAQFNEALEGGFTKLQIYGLDRLAFAKIRENFQGIDWETFASGDYILINTFTQENSDEVALYKVGETVTLENDSGETRAFTVLGYMSFPHAMSSQHGSIIDFALTMSSAAYSDFFGEQQAMGLLVDVADEYVDAADAWALSLCENECPELISRSKSYYVAEFESTQGTYLIIGGVLAGILALIGILNFVNTIATSIMTRKRELAMLQSVGMTSVQLKRMLSFEGIIYALLTLLFTMTAGLLLSAALIRGIAGTIWFFRFTFSIAPMLIAAPVLLLLCFAIPLLCARILQKESVVERLREN